MASIEKVVKVSIARGTQTVTQKGFGRALVLGTSTVLGTDRYRIYSSPDAMIEDGWAGTEPEYLAVASMFSGDIAPVDVMVGRRVASPAETPTQAIAAIRAVTGGDDWYALVLCSRVKADILDAAATIESLSSKKIFLACTEDADVPTAATDDVASTIKTASRLRTLVFYSQGSADTFPEAALLGYSLPRTPGSMSYALKNLPGTATDDLTDTQMSYLDGKNAMYYVEMGGNGATLGGKTGSEWLDVVNVIDWTVARMEEGIFGAMLQLPKVPYTDQGISIIANQVKAVMAQGVVNGGYSDYSINIPKAADISSVDKANRVLNGLTFVGYLAGAIHKVQVQGTVTY